MADRVLAAANVENPEPQAVTDLIGTVNASLRNHAGKGVERVNDGIPAKWVLTRT
jgi:hypothetical protein